MSMTKNLIIFMRMTNLIFRVWTNLNFNWKLNLPYCSRFLFFIFLLSAFLLNFFLCKDHWNGNVPRNLAQPCYVALGQALIWGLLIRKIAKSSENKCQNHRALSMNVNIGTADQLFLFEDQDCIGRNIPF